MMPTTAMTAADSAPGVAPRMPSTSSEPWRAGSHSHNLTGAINRTVISKTPRRTPMAALRARTAIPPHPPSVLPGGGPPRHAPQIAELLAESRRQPVGEPQGDVPAPGHPPDLARPDRIT